MDDTDFYRSQEEQVKLFDKYLKKIVIANMQNTNEYDASLSSTTLAPFIDQDEYSKVLWYVVGFSGLIAFFLVVSCSEWCCRVHSDHSLQAASRNNSAPHTSVALQPTQETPPPAYDLFAPPSYDSLNASCYGEKTEFDVYVVPVHALGSMVQQQCGRKASVVGEGDEPPSYSAVNLSCLHETLK